MAKTQKTVYSCSGCSNAAQMANDIAIKLDRDHQAEMSCIAGVGGNVPSLVRKAKAAEEIIAIDGCSLHCVAKCLEMHGLVPTHHFDLSELGIKKELHCDYSEIEFGRAYDHCLAIISDKVE